MIKQLKKLSSWYYTFSVKRKCGKHGNFLSVNGWTKVTKTTFLGNNVNFNGMKIFGCGNVFIGDNFHSGEECMMLTQVHNYEGKCIPYDRTYICKDIVIDNNVWLGTRVMILSGVTIGEGAIIQAGSVVVSDIPKYAIAGGHPAKVFSTRDSIHYENLKSKGKFH